MKKIYKKLCDRNMRLKKTKQKHLIESSIRIDSTLTTREESDEETEHIDKYFEPFCPNLFDCERRGLLKSNVCHVADKYQIGHCTLTESVFTDKVTHESASQVTLSIITYKC